ncbi:MAG: DUF998 domain-containing protein [Halobacteriales archaeon]|nr:DUF998 domain-containing protein [Halobacteriales archaeon]
MDDYRRAAAWAGLASSVVGFGTILLATLVSPTFSWTASALSDLGAAGEPTAWLFNGGLIAAGVVGLPFGWALFATARGALERAGAAAFAGSVAALALVGAFPTGTPTHFPVAVAYFLLFTLAMWLHGAGAALAGDVRRGLAAVGLGILHLLAWLAWAAVGPPGLALPELGGSVLLLGWLVLTTRWIHRETTWARGGEAAVT